MAQIKTIKIISRTTATFMESTSERFKHKIIDGRAIAGRIREELRLKILQRQQSCKKDC